ncbi:Zinc finger protein [Paragonimus skrjabini miyazakii]|uniref:Zinc finger protein n=1 Tax=Paragonimus skrjabini miyazakii TaxID=59628 RepID=A0A8S9YV74_9TREM|nr:Zinc finger protein [Paragonimus skrjabini miyazakii]
MTMFCNEELSPFDENENCGITDIIKFKKLVKSASKSAATLSLNDLPAAFQLSFSLIESISDLMLEAVSFLKADSSFHSVRTTVKRIEKNEDAEIILKGSSCEDPQPQKRTLLVDKTATEQDMNPLRTVYRTANLTPMNASEAKSHNSISPKRLFNEISPEYPRESKQKASTKNGNDSFDDFSIHSKVEEKQGDIVSEVEGVTALEKKNQLEPESETSMQPVRGKAPKLIDSPILSQTPEGCNSNNCRAEWHVNSRTTTDLRRWRLTSTDRLNSLIDECERQINGRKLYVCKFCGKVYEIKSSMRYHMKIIHLQMHLRTTEMQCRICGKQFTCVSAVNRHQAKCVLSTYPEPSAHRMKNGTFPLSSASGLTHVSRTITDSLLNDDVTDADCAFRFSQKTMNDPSALNSSLSNSAFHQLANDLPPSSSMLCQSTSDVYRDISPYAIPHCPIGLMEPLQVERTEERCFSPNRSIRASDIRNDLEFHNSCINSTPVGWPSFPPLSNGIADMTPIQLEMCMKAVVQGIHSNINSLTMNQQSSLQNDVFSENKVDFPVVLRPNDAHRSSFSSACTPSETSENDSAIPIDERDVAMDLSSRSRSDSVMIESF